MDSKYSLLVVDDQMAIRMLLKEALKDEYHVDEAENGYQALEKIRARDINLMILDMKMPGLNGIETLKQARAKGYHAPAILMTAIDTDEIINQVASLGLVDYISKPFDLCQMRQLVAQQLKPETAK